MRVTIGEKEFSAVSEQSMLNKLKVHKSALKKKRRALQLRVEELDNLVVELDYQASAVATQINRGTQLCVRCYELQNHVTDEEGRYSCKSL
jgi:predicted  nucleic acid-binding Zn-ribbon protein